MKTFYSNKTFFYRLGMQLSGFAHYLERYVKRLPIHLPSGAKILDVGCGTGLLGISLKKAFPDSVVLATDLESTFFDRIRKDIESYNFSKDEFSLAVSDINTPEQVYFPNEQNNLVLRPETFDIVIVGASLGYSDNLEQSIIRLSKLVKHGGYLIDIEMSEGIIGRMWSRFFKYKKPKVVNVIKTLRENGFVVRRIPFEFCELSARLSRTGIFAEKS